VLSAQKSNRISEAGKITGAGVANLSGGCTDEVDCLFFRQALSQKTSEHWIIFGEPVPL